LTIPRIPVGTGRFSSADADHNVIQPAKQPAKEKPRNARGFGGKRGVGGDGLTFRSIKQCVARRFVPAELSSAVGGDPGSRNGNPMRYLAPELPGTDVLDRAERWR
jgi:hypothetical protein